MPVQTPAAPPSAPATPAPPGVVAAPAQPGATQVPAAAAPSLSFLRARRSALSSQLESATRRREEVAEQLRDEKTTAAERPGLEDRLRVLDERIVKLERDISANSEQIANAPAQSSRDAMTIAPAAGASGIRVNGNLISILGFALLMPFAVQIARRLFAPNRVPSGAAAVGAGTVALQDRMDRLEAAVDAVAIEVERIGEAQRFLTQAMTGAGQDAPALGAGSPAFQGVPVRQHVPSEPR